MKLLILLLVAIFIVSCTQTVSELPPVQQTVSIQEPQQSDDYLDIQTAEDDFNAIEETLDSLP